LAVELGKNCCRTAPRRPPGTFAVPCDEVHDNTGSTLLSVTHPITCAVDVDTWVGIVEIIVGRVGVGNW
jgi:5,10-methenyltetrahydromethanopterin hydrogenase